MTRRRRAVLVTALVLGLLGGLTWVALGSSLLGTRDVEVAGTAALSADEVRSAAAVPLGTPLLRLDTDVIEARVAALPRVAAVRVGRTLTGTVRIDVTERVPVAVLIAPDGTHLIDATATDFATVPTGPAGVPELRVRRAAPDDPAAAAAVAVLVGLPDLLRADTRLVTAGSPADVVLTLGDGREVRWGGADAGERKAAVLDPLLTQPGRIYDVSSPDLPTIS